MNRATDVEFRAMRRVLEALELLTNDQRARVLQYTADRIRDERAQTLADAASQPTNDPATAQAKLPI